VGVELEDGKSLVSAFKQLAEQVSTQQSQLAAQQSQIANLMTQNTLLSRDFTSLRKKRDKLKTGSKKDR
jgi:regulator of replication initiation timing